MTQALYRRYRPATFAEVIGQDHVTGPLQQALRHNRTHHAYLFSGPRGCGKTTSARIMARCLNCEQGPTPDPCGVCDSCLGLAPGGGGSLDVIEIDAATHGLVDDARDLRERAFFSPASSRFKVYIVDEAHMLGPGASNALLKVVEEPPAHVKFIFATTEPDKLIATIRSRVHHYPFRLVPPGALQAYLATVVEKEGVTAELGALSLVVRAGRGSVRDSMSVLDQLVSGAPDVGITYDYAAGLLGLTDATLLDDTVEAFAAGDGASVFRIVDQVVEAGHDPRRFAEDLLERLRDLVVIDAVPDAAGAILGEHPEDELDRMRRQSSLFGAAQLSRAADIVNEGLIEMRGATAPRLQLELMCARVLLPAADDSARGLAARLDRLERRADIAAPTEAAFRPTPSGGTTGGGPAQSAGPPDTGPRDATAAATPGGGGAGTEPESHPKADPTGGADDAAPSGTRGVDLVTVRRRWPEVLDALARLKRTTWIFVSQSVQVKSLDEGRLTLAFSSAGLRDTYLNRSDHQDFLAEALIRVLGVEWTIDAIVEPAAASGAGAPPPGQPATPRTAEPAAPEHVAQPDTRHVATAGHVAATADPGVPGDDDLPSPDDEDVDDGALTHHDLLARELGAKIIDEYDVS